MMTRDAKIALYDRLADQRADWRRRNAYYYDQLEGLIADLVRPGARVLEIGCGTGELLAAVRPSRGLGIDFAPRMIDAARKSFPSAQYPNLSFEVGDAEALALDETFDYVILSDVIGELTDVWSAFRQLNRVSRPDTRVLVTYFNGLWAPLLRIGERLGLKMPQDNQNWLDPRDIANLLALNGFELVRRGWALPLPKRVPLVSPLVNRWLGRLPLLERLGLIVWLVARPRPRPAAEQPRPSVTVVIPCRNERGNIRAAVERIPPMGSSSEILFVDGNSNDGTVAEIEAVMAERPRHVIRLLHQIPPGSSDGAGHGRMLRLGKGDAVRKGFAAATGDVLMILDADLTVPPEELPRFYLALVEGHGELINGTRLVYPMEREAMRTLNRLANHVFGWLFSWLLGQRIKDTLCGTKVLYRRDYARIAEGRAYFGDFDPFGDFDLLFGAARQNLAIVEMPVHYRERTYGEIKIERFKHGWLLLRMSLIAMGKLKFPRYGNASIGAAAGSLSREDTE